MYITCVYIVHVYGLTSTAGSCPVSSDSARVLGCVIDSDNTSFFQDIHTLCVCVQVSERVSKRVNVCVCVCVCVSCLSPYLRVGSRQEM